MNRITQKIKIFAALLVFTFALTTTAVTAYAGPADNSLSTLSLSEGTLSPSFEGSKLNYSATVSADTTSVEVTAKPVNSAASVISITGNTDLAVGTNKIQVVVEAENGNLATYTITVTRPESGAASEPQQEEPQQEQPQQEPAASEGEEQTGEPTGGMVSDGVSYTISDDYKEEQIPQDFTEISVTYQGEEHKGLLCDYADITLVYMTNEEGEGAFFIYDAASEDTYPFIRLSTENSSIILIRHAAPGEEYAPAELTFGDYIFTNAFQLSQGDFYQVYAVNSVGVEGWYQYDASEGTYQRYTVETFAEEQPDTGNEYLQQALSDLNDKYTARKDRDMKIIAALIVVCVILLFVILNLVLRARRSEQGEEDDFDENDGDIELSNLSSDMDLEISMDAEPEVESKPEQKSDLEAEDEAFAEFEEEPQLLSGRKAKREQKKKERREKHERVRDIFDDDDSQSSIFTKEKIYSGQDSDDDLEVMDLNDL
ncbi:MAG: cadherin-like beta sandwich domain-containing protein [Lachnospiraceae bacterium]|nr:cadherin-like beta sandwich domain-containing protein [Lachnospiraceae bacterium]